MAHSLAWSDLNNEQVDDLIHCNTMEEMKEKMERYAMKEDMFSTNDDMVTENQIGQWKAIIRDFFCQNVAFALRCDMDNYKLSTFFSIAKKVHLQSMAEKLTIVESFDAMKQLIVDHSVHQPPFRVQIFNMDDVKMMTEYLHDTYYRHYKLYQFAFCKKDVANIRTKTIDEFIESPCELPPLMTATTEEKWDEEKRIEEEKEKERRQLELEAKDVQADEENPVEKDKEDDGVNHVKEEEKNSTTSNEPSNLHPMLMGQLESVKEELLRMTGEKIGQLQSKVEELQGHIEAMSPDSTSKKKRKSTPAGKK